MNPNSHSGLPATQHLLPFPSHNCCTLSIITPCSKSAFRVDQQQTEGKNWMFHLLQTALISYLAWVLPTIHICGTNERHHESTGYEGPLKQRSLCPHVSTWLKREESRTHNLRVWLIVTPSAGPRPGPPGESSYSQPLAARSAAVHRTETRTHIPAPISPGNQRQCG